MLVRLLCSSVWKNEYLQKFCWDAPRDRRSPVPELPNCSLQKCPVPVPMLYRVLIHHDGDGSFLHAFDIIAEGDQQTTAPAFVDGLFESFYSFFQTLSYRRYPGWCLLLAPIPRPATILDKRCASRASPFFCASLSCSRRFVSCLSRASFLSRLD